MKKLKLYIILFSSIVLAASCNEDELLTQVNPNKITADTFWKSESDFDKGLTTVYGALQFSSISGAMLSYEMVQGDLAGTENWYPQDPFATLTFTDASAHVQNKWNELYVGVFRANQVIDNLSNEDANITEGAATLIEAQAKFLRAFYYFQLVHTYGGAVLHTSVAATPEDYNKPFLSKEDITSQVIVPDLEFAKANLPQVWEDSDDLGRVTWGSATSLLGKVYLYDEMWTKASVEFKEVIDSRLYNLTASVMDNYTDENEFNSESIFEVSFSEVLKPGTQGATVDDNQNETSGEATTLARQMAQLNFGGWNTVLSSYYLHELMVNDEPDMSNPINNDFTYSQRMYSSIAPVDSDGEYYGLPTGTKGGWAYGQSAYIKKHSNWYQWDLEDANERSGINFRHIRYADVLLMYAESILNERGDAAAADAIMYIDMVRARAGVVTLQAYLDDNSNTFPALHRSAQLHGAHQLVAPTADNLLTHLMKVERPLELCYEGHRWKDLVRWGIVGEMLTSHRADEENRLSMFSAGTLTGLPAIEERIRPDYAVSAGSYSPAAHDYFPVPTSERQINSNLGL